MTVVACIVMTTAQRDAAMLLNDDDIAVDPRQIDNPLANNLGFGTLVGQWVVSAHLLNDPAYVRWVPTLGTFPIHVMDSETLFVPVPA